MRQKFTISILFYRFLWYPIICFLLISLIFPVKAEEIFDPSLKINDLGAKLEAEKKQAENEKLTLQSHIQKCESFISSLNSSKDSGSVSIAQEAISKDKSAIANIELRIQEIDHRLKLNDRAKEYLKGSSTAGIGLASCDVKGEVYISRGGGKKIRLHSGMNLASGDKITTGRNSQVSFLTLDGSKIMLRSSTTFELVEDNFDVSISKITKGKLKMFIAYKNKLLNRRFRVRTPNVTIAVRGTVFEVEVDEQGHTHVSVQEGIVEIQKTIMLHPSQTWTEKD